MVTGGGGFLGAALVRQLIQMGYQVHGFSRKSYPELIDLGATWSTGDIRDADAVAQACRHVDVVFHTAALAGVWGDRATYFGINTRGTENVIAGCRAHQVQKLVYTSSPSVTFDGGDQNGVDESVGYPNKFLAHYPHSKAFAEQAVLAANNQQLSTCSLRPHLIWGPDDPHLIPRIVDRARRGRLRRIGNGQNLVDICYVDNAASAHCRAAAELFGEAKCAGKAYFISQGEPVNCWDWIDDVLTIAGEEKLSKSISYRSAYFVGGILESIYSVLRRKAEPPMTRFVASQLATSHYFDVTAAKRDFGYEAEVTTADGMSRLAESL
jgi:nucleoside-diphosphate-sugar epimerase